MFSFQWHVKATKKGVPSCCSIERDLITYIVFSPSLFDNSQPEFLDVALFRNTILAHFFLANQLKSETPF